jgi:hypothetical protein
MPGLRTANLNCCSRRRSSWNPLSSGGEDVKPRGYLPTTYHGALSRTLGTTAPSGGIARIDRAAFIT